jgi:hypothetical protein
VIGARWPVRWDSLCLVGFAHQNFHLLEAGHPGGPEATVSSENLEAAVRLEKDRRRFEYAEGFY